MDNPGRAGPKSVIIYQISTTNENYFDRNLRLDESERHKMIFPVDKIVCRTTGEFQDEAENVARMLVQSDPPQFRFLSH